MVERAAVVAFGQVLDADQVDVDNEPRDLMDLYPGRSFRFCFTNGQIAEAVTDFLWHQEDLRPDPGPVYLTFWEDDPYSEDLFNRFRGAKA